MFTLDRIFIEINLRQQNPFKFKPRRHLCPFSANFGRAVWCMFLPTKCVLISRVLKLQYQITRAVARRHTWKGGTKRIYLLNVYYRPNPELNRQNMCICVTSLFVCEDDFNLYTFKSLNLCCTAIVYTLVLICAADLTSGIK